MTPEDFRRLALELVDASEDAHMGHPDFRLHGRIFATLGYPDDSWAMIKLPPAEQARYVEAYPGVFVPAKGKWGLQGSTNVRLAAAPEDAVRGAIGAAWLALSAPRSRKTAKPY
jgi:hypothetical protein